MNRRLGSAWGLPEICRILDICHTSPSVADFELCEPVNKNYPLLKTLVSRLTSTRSQAGNLSKSNLVVTLPFPIRRQKVNSQGWVREGGAVLLASRSECDICEHFDTNEYPNIFVSKN